MPSLHMAIIYNLKSSTSVGIQPLHHTLHSMRIPQVCLMGKYHNILYIGLRTCWDWGVRDSEVVVKLLGKWSRAN